MRVYVLDTGGGEDRDGKEMRKQVLTQKEQEIHGW